MYVTMLFVYNWLARHEEKECEEKFGESFKAYVRSAPKFIPVRIPALRQFSSWPQSGAKRLIANLLLFGMVMTLFLGVAFGARNYALNTISISYSKDSATIAKNIKYFSRRPNYPRQIQLPAPISSKRRWHEH